MCELEVELDGGRVRVRGRARDFSESAVCILASEPIDPGKNVQVHLRLVLERGISEPLVVPGVIAWLTASEGMQQIGVAFTVMAPEVRQRLGVLSKILHGQISLPAPAN